MNRAFARVGLRLHVGPSAFGNALGSSLVAGRNNDSNESRLKAIGDDIKNGQRFADASLDQSSRLFNPDSDGDIRSDWG
ncbi:hypothetical protein F2P45_34745, partial [Massilia sp. CCM 8733]